MSDVMIAAATPETPDAGATVPAGQTAATPATPAPFASFPDSESLSKRLDREARKQMNASAKEFGYEDWQHLQTELAAQRQPAPVSTSSTPAMPAATGSDVSEAARLRLALQVATELNLPPALIGRLQGETAEAMKADAQGLVAIMQQSQGRTPGIPPAPQGGQAVTFTRAQLRDAAFVRANSAEILRAGREGRIVS